MIIALLLVGVAMAQECTELGYVTTATVDDEVGQRQLLMRLQGEFIIGYGDNYTVKDESKIQLVDRATNIEYKATNFQVLCPARHFEEECEIYIVLSSLTQVKQMAFLVLPVEEDDDIERNPLFIVDQQFELKLPQLANQLEERTLYYQYSNCNSIYYVLKESLDITRVQLEELKKYSVSIGNDAIPLSTDVMSGLLYLENFTTDSESSFHLYGLIVVIIGVVILTIIRAFKKKDVSNNEQQQQLVEQEMPKLGEK